ncbi:transcription elongation factor SPT6 isoform X2 [Contarinia nasturtii]|uniref:transcription elongation factor SPT6 isoform X2 n=1 Tax=Contarinia nasturtii TaxID=265458 RepID=UPI0012D4605F|nr:transcription elongation factor SPT6 isoform X2 [Contarinia nasturtii]
MADFLDSEASESDNSENEDLEPHERRKLKKIKAMSDSEEDDDGDEDGGVLDDLIDDNPIEEDSDAANSDGSRRQKRRSRSDDELDDRLEDDDYDLLEENLGVKVQRRKRFKRLKRMQIEDSDGEEEEDSGMDREKIANQLFDGDDDDEGRRSVQDHQRMEAEYDEEIEDEESDADDFIVDDDGQPITQKKKKARRIFSDVNLQEGQDIFGVDFDYDEFEKYGEDYESESEAEDDYEDEGVDGEREKRPKKTTKKKTTKKSIFEIYEPSELKRGHFTDVDNEIRKTDIPERIQLRDIPITAVPENSVELEEEAEWIYKQAFTRSTVSDRTGTGEEWLEKNKPPSSIAKIKQALDFMRNQQLEVPFIAFYRKEYVRPELDINDLWTVYKYDSKWCQLHTRKRNLALLFEKMRNYQLDKLMNNPDNAIPDDVRLIKDDDIDRLNAVQTPEELKDVHAHFLLHYAHEIPEMQQSWRKKEKEKRKLERLEARRKQLDMLEEGAEPPEEIPDEDDDDDQVEDTLKAARDSGPYSMCRKAGILGFAKRFGLTPEQFAENLRDNYQRHDVEQEALAPHEVANEYVSKRFQTIDEILHAVKFAVARQISREPMLRKSVREVYYERAKISVNPTKQGQKEVDENHAVYAMKYLKNKPVRDLTGDQFLKLCMAEDDKLITITISEVIEGNTSSSYLEEVKQFYQRDEFSKNVQEWNALRASCVEEAITKMVLPDLRKELKSILLAESKEYVLLSCAHKLSEWIKPAPYSVSFPDEDDDDWDTTKGVRVMSVAFDDDPSQAAFTVLINTDGEVTDYLRLPKFTYRRGKFTPDDKDAPDTEALVNFVRTKKPHVIVVGGESMRATKVQRDLEELVGYLMENSDEPFPKIPVEIINNDLAKVYANSKKGSTDFREYPIILRQAISVARRLQDPLIEYSQLCTTDEEILCLRYNTLQDQLLKEDLLDAINLEFVNRTNEVGVDINLAVQNSLTMNLVQFICGLGPRKGQALLKILKQTNQRLENRTQLVTHCHMGPKVFINCSGFIKIDTNSLGDSTETYVEVLDGSRVHPETYEWARKMAVDALEYDDDEANPAGALEEILESPERLKDLDLDAFAVELERQGFGNKSITLYDIRNELNSRYKDLRPAYKPLSREELFEVLTKENRNTFYVGKLVLAKVIGIVHRKPQGDQLDNADPEKNVETGLWQCPFCMKNDFPELNDVWNHFDASECPGKATGIRIVLENGVTGFIHLKQMSDKHVTHPEERVHIGQAIHCRIIKIDYERFSVDCSSKSSDLLDRNNEWRPKKDNYYDHDQEEKEMRKEDESKKQTARQQYTKRIIVHPAFHNKSYAEAVKIMATMDQGEVIIRPSSKGSDHLTVTWKVANDIYQHIDVREEGKENVFSLGSSLWIGNDEFEDLDEIIARHVTPMAQYARDLLGYKYYRDAAGGMKDKMEEMLKEEKKKNPNKIHYFLSASKNYPGKFLLSYLPRGKIRHEYVSVTPDGFRFRQQAFESLNSLLKWFKEHFKDPIPTATPTPTITPRGSVASSTRSSFPTPNISQTSYASEAINKVARNLPSHMLHSLSQVANKTPHYPHTPGAYGSQSSYVNTPYTPSGQTPFMTPYQTPHHAVQTPRYGAQSTPSAVFAHPKPPAQNRPRSNQYQGNHSQNQQWASGNRSRNSHRASPHVPSPRNRYTPTQSSHSRPHHQSQSSYSKPSASNGTAGDDDWDDDDWDAPTQRATPKQSNKPTSSYQADAEDDWDDAVASWGKQVSSKSNTPRYDDKGKQTPQYQSGKSPRSVRSTPRTDTSPRSMTLGDATPLYDENI